MVHHGKDIENSNYILERIYISKEPILILNGDNFYAILSIEELTYPEQYNFDPSVLMINKTDHHHFSLIIKYDKFHHQLYHLLSDEKRELLKIFQSHQKRIAKMVNQILSGSRYITLPKH